MVFWEIPSSREREREARAPVFLFVRTHTRRLAAPLAPSSRTPRPPRSPRRAAVPPFSSAGAEQSPPPTHGYRFAFRSRLRNYGCVSSDRFGYDLESSNVLVDVSTWALQNTLHRTLEPRTLSLTHSQTPNGRILQIEYSRVVDAEQSTLSAFGVGCWCASQGRSRRRSSCGASRRCAGARPASCSARDASTL